MLIDTWAAKQLRLKPSGNTITMAPGHAKVETTFLSSVWLKKIGGNGDLPVNLDSAGITDLSLFQEGIGQPRIAGILGLPILTAGTVRFDFAAKTMTLFEQPHLPLRIPGATTLPLKHTQDGRCAVAVSPQDGLFADLVVDTGSPISCLPIALTSQLHPLAMTFGGSETFGGWFVTSILLLSHLKLGEFTEPNVTVGGMPPSAGAPLGMDILTRFRVTLDFANAEMTLERPKDYAQRIRQDGRLGIEMYRRNTKYYVKSVKAGSPAQKAGVHKDDQIVEVDGHALDSLPSTAAENSLTGLAGTRARLVLIRPNRQQYRVTCERKSAFDMRNAQSLGMNLQKMKDKRIVVLGVLPGYKAAKAGIHAGDEIMTINSIATDKMTLEQFMSIPEDRLMVMQIRLAGSPQLLEIKLQADSRSH